MTIFSRTTRRDARVRSIRRRSLPRLEQLEERRVLSTFTVTQDDPEGSLAHAIHDANIHPGRDIITFEPGVSGTIEVTGSLEIADAVEIQGPGADDVTIRARTFQ